MARNNRAALALCCCGAWLSLLAAGNAAAEPLDGRVYEQVSPVAKNGADVMPDPQRTRAAAGGDAVQFASLTAFGDVRGGSLATEYIGRRDPETGGWSVHGITPPQQPGAATDVLIHGLESRYLGEFSSDLSQGVFMAKSPLTNAPNVEDVVNLYLRDDLLTAGVGSYRLLTPAITLQEDLPLQPVVKPFVVGASADFSHVVFESQRNLTLDSSELDGTKLYVWANDALRLVGVLPNGDPTRAQAGQGASIPRKSYATGTVSEDGARIIFTAPPFSQDERGGALYVRDDHGTADAADDTTTSVNISERTDCNGDPQCGGDGVPDPTPDPSNPGGVSQPATYWAASRDASVVFFTTSEQLTDDDVNHTGDLYRVKLTAPVGERLERISVDLEPADNPGGDVTNGHAAEGVLGASFDGETIYFIDGGQLVSGNPTSCMGTEGECDRIFVWHAGRSLNEVGAINPGAEADQLVGAPGWGLTPQSSRVTPDGRFLAFLSKGTSELLTLHGADAEYAHRGHTEVYVYDRDSESLDCASCNPTNVGATADATFYRRTQGYGIHFDTSHLSHVLSDDGRYVFFETSERLQDEDKNDALDVYEYDTAPRRVQLVSGGTASGDSVLLDASADGHDVFFTTRDRLRSSDTDESRDLYDARIDGVPDPGGTAELPCADDGCRPAARPAPHAIVPPSVGSNSRGDHTERPGVLAVFTIDPIELKQRRHWARHGSVRITLRASRPGTMTIRLRARLRGRVRTIQTSTRRLSRPATVTLPLYLDRRARRQLQHRHYLRLAIQVTYSQSPTLQVTYITLVKS